MDITLGRLRKAFDERKYICNDEMLITVYLALKLKKPLLVEGEPGVGKTELAKVLSDILNAELIRLQCYEGLDENKALYEWNYQKQLISIQMCRINETEGLLQEDLFSQDYLLARPILKAIQGQAKSILLIDEIDKADEEFEAFLLEFLSDFQISIPELGTIKAKKIPLVVLTSNAIRELSDGLKRRCAYLYIDYPSIEKETSIILAKVPSIEMALAREIAAGVYYLRNKIELQKKPSIAETLDWAKALVDLGAGHIYGDEIRKTLGLFVKNKQDLELFGDMDVVLGMERGIRENIASRLNKGKG